MIMNLTFMGPFKFMIYEVWESFSLTLYIILIVLFKICKMNYDVPLNRLIMGLTEFIFGFSNQEARNFKR